MRDGLIRVLVAEDSPTARAYLIQIINSAPGLAVVGEARDGMEALEQTVALRPNVVSMDIRMPRMDGLEATRRIMALAPRPIVIVSALLDEEIDLSFRAIKAGALAVIEKPPARDDAPARQKRRQLTTTLTAMSSVSVVRRWERLPRQTGMLTGLPMLPTPVKPEIVAIGASAGGPSALSTLLGKLPAHFPLPIVIVQHLPDEFINGLARWLSNATPLPVQVVTDGQPLEASQVYLAPGSAHLAVQRQGDQLTARLVKEKGDYRYYPSVDVLLRSVAETCGQRGVGVILSGMGDDGAEGLLTLRQAGGRTFAQDQASSAVYGMPAAAMERGGAEQASPIDRMARALLNLL